MKVFISWSGQQSRDVASLLRDWLPEILPKLEVWLAADVLGPDNHWLTSMSGGLRASDAVVACVTADSLDSEWQSVASLETSAASSRAVIPWIIGVTKEDLPGPLKRFQAYGSAESEMSLLVNLLNDMSDVAEDRALIEQRMLLNWSRFEIGLNHILNPPSIHMVGGSTLTIEATIEADGEVRESDACLVDQHYQLLRDVRSLLTRVLEQPQPLLSLKNIPEVKKTTKPRLFIGSSTDGLRLVNAIQECLEYDRVQVTGWHQNVFGAGDTPIETLVDAVRNFDYALIVMTAVDEVTRGADKYPVPRDNLLFELGLFIGALGRGQAFIMRARGVPLKLPSDLDGVLTYEYNEPEDGNLVGAVNPVCEKIRRKMGISK